MINHTRQTKRAFSKAYLRRKAMNPKDKSIREQVSYRFNMIEAWRDLVNKGICTPTPAEYKAEISRILISIINLNARLKPSPPSPPPSTATNQTPASL